MRSTILLCIIITTYGGVQGSEELVKKLEGFDTGFGRVFGLGDKDHLYPQTAGEMKKICTNFVNVLANNPDLISSFSKDIENKIARRDALDSVRGLFYNELCRMVDEKVQQGKENGIMKILHDINSKVDQLAEIKANMGPVFIEASQPTSNMTLKELACYLRKYVNEMAGLFTGETKKFIYSFMSPFLKIPNRYIKGEGKCSWSDVPKPTGPVPKSVELLYAQVATNILNKFQPDTYVHPG